MGDADCLNRAFGARHRRGQNPGRRFAVAWAMSESAPLGLAGATDYDCTLAKFPTLQLPASGRFLSDEEKLAAVNSRRRAEYAD
jgi:hypothetical protein